jgi:hypothetical protein
MLSPDEIVQCLWALVFSCEETMSVIYLVTLQKFYFITLVLLIILKSLPPLAILNCFKALTLYSHKRFTQINAENF